MRTSGIDLVILGVMMPGEDELRSAARLRELGIP
jgi:DNA-binding response OmpR family regulator